MSLANELAALAMEHVHDHIRPGMKESEVGAMYEGFVHGLGVGYKGKVEMARAFTLVWSERELRPLRLPVTALFRSTSPRCWNLGMCGRLLDGLDQECLSGDLTSEYHRLLDLLLKVFNEAVSYAKDGASFPELIA